MGGHATLTSPARPRAVSQLEVTPSLGIPLRLDATEEPCLRDVRPQMLRQRSRCRRAQRRCSHRRRPDRFSLDLPAAEGRQDGLDAACPSCAKSRSSYDRLPVRTSPFSLTTRTCVRSFASGSQGSRSPTRLVLQLAASLREAALVDTAEPLKALTTAKPGSSPSTSPTGKRSCACSRTLPRSCSSCGRRCSRSMSGGRRRALGDHRRRGIV